MAIYLHITNQLIILHNNNNGSLAFTYNILSTSLSINISVAVQAPNPPAATHNWLNLPKK